MNNNYKELPIIIKMRELYKIYYNIALLFPKKDRYLLGSKCEMYILDTLELLLAAGSAPKTEKMVIIRKANVKFDALKVFLRIAKDLKILENKKYIILQKQIQEIGRMLGGWQRSLS